MDIRFQIGEIAKKAKNAATVLARVSSDAKDKVLLDMAEALTRQSRTLIAENAKDLEKAMQTGLSEAMIDRLTHKSYIVNMNGPSYRVKETKEWLESQN
jgi:gamma-glutamyl phosphate reductase